MVSFTYRRSKSADAYTVAAHYGVLRVTVLIEVCHIHTLCIFCSELEYVSYLDAA